MYILIHFPLLLASPLAVKTQLFVLHLLYFILTSNSYSFFFFSYFLFALPPLTLTSYLHNH